MTIKIYPSLMEGAPIETHEWDGTIGAWFDHHEIDYLSMEPQPVAVTVNGKAIGAAQWGNTHISNLNEVEIRLIPHGGVFKAIGRVFNFLFGWLLPSKRTPTRHDPGQGRRLDTASTKANQAKLTEVVPELAGRHIRYPDYLTPPRRRFISPREQWLEFLACIGPGKYEVLPADVRIGDTQMQALGSDAEYQIFPPGQSVAGHSAHEHWHNVEEVGSTSSGTAGLELSIEIATTAHTPASSYIFSGNEIDIPMGDGSFPLGWGSGTHVLISLPLTYEAETVTTGFPINPIQVSQITGNFIHVLPFADGDTIDVSGAGLSGTYTINSFDIDSNGQGWVTLFTQGSAGEIPTPPAPVIISEGNHTLIFRARESSGLFGSIKRFSLVTSSDNSIVVMRINADGSQDASWLGFPSVTSTSATIAFNGGLTYGEWTSVIAACPISETTSLIELDFFFPSGLSQIEDDGTVIGRSVRTEVQYRDIAGGPFTSITRIYSNNTLNQIGYTWQIPVSNIRPEIRIRRVGSLSTSTQVNDTIQWFGLKSKLKTRTSYPNWTTIAIRMRSGGKLGSQAENKLNLIATRILPRLMPDGTWGPEAPTRSIADFVKYITSTIGYTDDNLNMEDLTRLSQVWNGRGEYLDYVYDETTVKAALDLALGAGMSEFSVEDGRIRPVRDDVRTTWEQGYSPQNMLRPLRRSFSPRKHDDPDGVEVEYINANSWTTDVVQCRLPGDQGFKVAKVRADGVTSKTRAWRIGMRHLRALRYRRWRYSFQTELEGLNSQYLSYVPLVGEDPSYGQSAILTSITEHQGRALLRVTEPLDWHDGEDHVVAYRRVDGSVAGPFLATPGLDEFSVMSDISKPWPVVTLKHEPPHVYFGTVSKWCFPALINDISPSNTETVSVSALNYDIRVYADDNNSPQD